MLIRSWSFGFGRSKLVRFLPFCFLKYVQFLSDWYYGHAQNNFHCIDILAYQKRNSITKMTLIFIHKLRHLNLTDKIFLIHFFFHLRMIINASLNKKNQYTRFWQDLGTCWSSWFMAVLALANAVFCHSYWRNCSYHICIHR